MKKIITNTLHSIGGLIAAFYLCILTFAFLFAIPVGLILIVAITSADLFETYEIHPALSFFIIGLFFYRFVWLNGCYEFLNNFLKKFNEGGIWPYNSEYWLNKGLGKKEQIEKEVARKEK